MQYDESTYVTWSLATKTAIFNWHVCGIARPFLMRWRFFNVIVRSPWASVAAICQFPDRLYACVGGESTLVGLFCPFLDDKRSRTWWARQLAVGADWRALRIACHNLGQPRHLRKAFAGTMFARQAVNVQETHSIRRPVWLRWCIAVIAHLRNRCIKMDLRMGRWVNCPCTLLLKKEGYPALDVFMLWRRGVKSMLRYQRFKKF